MTDCIPLPAYSPSPPVPRYSCEPAYDEQILDRAPFMGNRSTPTGVFVKKVGKVTVVLNHQEDGAQTPSYGRRGLVSGTVCFDASSTICAVALKVGGHFSPQ